MGGRSAGSYCRSPLCSSPDSRALSPCSARAATRAPNPAPTSGSSSGPISARNSTDLEPEADRSRRGVRPISAKGSEERKKREKSEGPEPCEFRAFRSGSDRRRSGDLSIFSRTLYQLSYRASGWHRPGLARPDRPSATSTGLEPATSAVTGRRANQLRHEASCGTKPDSTRVASLARVSTPNGIRTRATAVKGRGPRPLDDGGQGPSTSSRLEPG